MGRTGRREGGAALLALAALLCAAGGAAAQDEVERARPRLADYDYENLHFRGVGLQVGHLWASRIESAMTFGARMDMGFLGPGLRIVPSITYWSSSLKAGEVEDFERRLEELIQRQDPDAPPTDIELGEIDWSDVVLSLDGHLVWTVPLDVLTYAGLGVSAHLMNGEGSSIDGTFVEDFLDSITAGFNLHAGAEYAVHERLRLYGDARYEMTGDLQYLEVRVGGQFMVSLETVIEDREEP